MIVVHNESNVTLFWSIFKGVSSQLEDFSRAILKVFLVSTDDKVPVEYEALKDGRLKIELPSGLATDVYGVEAVWVQNPHRTRLARGTDCLCHASVLRAFAVTDVEDEATNSGSIKLSIRSQVATYGKDGMNAYELCVLYGKWGSSLQDWLESKLGQVITTEQIADGAVTPDKMSAGFQTNLGQLISDVESLKTTVRGKAESTLVELLSQRIGNLSALGTSVKTSLVNAVNEVLEIIDLLEGTVNDKADQASVTDINRRLGALDALKTTVKTSIVNAINEVWQAAESLRKEDDDIWDAVDQISDDVAAAAPLAALDALGTKVGHLPNLATINKKNLVDAINEVLAKTNHLWDTAKSKGWTLDGFTPPTADNGESGNLGGGGTGTGSGGGIA